MREMYYFIKYELQQFWQRMKYNAGFSQRPKTVMNIFLILNIITLYAYALTKKWEYKISIIFLLITYVGSIIWWKYTTGDFRKTMPKKEQKKEEY